MAVAENLVVFFFFEHSFRQLFFRMDDFPEVGNAAFCRFLRRKIIFRYAEGFPRDDKFQYFFKKGHVEIEKEFGAFLVYLQEVVVKIVFEERSRVVVGFECADMLVYPVLGIVRPYVAYASAASGASLDRYAYKQRPVA